MFQPGTSNITMQWRKNIVAYSGTSAWISKSGKPAAAFGWDYEMSTGANSWIGTLRGIGPGRKNPSGAVLQSGGNDVAYAALTASWSTANECYYLKY
jgi:hypothetical protein